MKAPEHSIVLTREINAAPRDVYAGWTDPARMERWMGRVSADVRVGGAYRYEIPAEGGKTYIHSGEYLILEDGRRVVQSFLAGEPDPAVPNSYRNEFIEVRLEELGPSRTALTFTNGWDGEPLNEEGLAAVRAAWSEWLDRMEKSVLGGD